MPKADAKVAEVVFRGLLHLGVSTRERTEREQQGEFVGEKIKEAARKGGVCGAAHGWESDCLQLSARSLNKPTVP